ncbi:MAG: serine/threonine-protein kinase [Myxococcales bacterium]
MDENPASSSSPDDEPERKPLPKLGSTLGSYQLVKLLGVGGMGRVYVAEHVRLGRKVALKLLLPEFATSPEVVQRFFNEARAVNQINHPNIVEVMDFVEDPHGFNYFIMELLEGRDLRKVHKEDGPFLLGRAIAVAKQVASALAAAHGQGIVHRDIKPDNVLLCPREGSPNFVKLLDFGIAKLSSGVFQEQKTRLGMVLGTPGYMSPEQAFGRPIDGRSDVYSLGVLLHWMLVDKLPSAGNLPMKAQPKDEPPPDPLTHTARGQPIPEPIAQLVQRSLAFDPDDRVQTMERVLEELKPFVPTAIEPAPEELGHVSAPTQVDPWAKTVAPSEREVAARPQPSAEGETRLRQPREPRPNEHGAAAPLLEKKRGKLWLVGVLAAGIVAGGGWLALQTLRPGAPEAGLPPLPAPVAAAPRPEVPIPTLPAVPAPAAPVTPAPTAPQAAETIAESAPATPPAFRPHRTRAPARKAAKPAAAKAADDTTILDPLAE